MLAVLFRIFCINLVHLWFIVFIHVIRVIYHLRVGFWVLVYHSGLVFCRKTYLVEYLVPKLSWTDFLSFKVVGYNGGLAFRIV